jgi:D-methionine transport system ATP-binding protein
MKQSILEVINISRTFAKARQAALKDVYLSVDAGEIVGIIGMSGAGKTTLLRCLSGLDKPDSGTIRLNGIDLAVSGTQKRVVLRQIGVIFQHYYLFSSRTAAQNIAYPLEIQGIDPQTIQARVAELLAYVGLAHRKDAYPEQLSGGEKQRISIARALATEPPLLLCDEPTAALDPKTAQDIVQLLLRLNRDLGVAIVLISHHMELIKRACSRVIVLDQGCIVETGESATVLTQPQHVLTRQLLSYAQGEVLA